MAAGPRRPRDFFQLDAANRRIAIKDELAGVTDFHYDENGNQTILIDAEGQPTPEMNQGQ